MTDLPESLQATRAEAQRDISPLRPASHAEISGQPGILYAQRISASEALPPYYVVYFLLAELLDFPSFGADEKVAWTIPIVLDNQLLAVQHRKLGLGIFGLTPEREREVANRAIRLLRKSAETAKARAVGAAR